MIMSERKIMISFKFQIKRISYFFSSTFHENFLTLILERKCRCIVVVFVQDCSWILRLHQFELLGISSAQDQRLRKN